MTQIWMEKGKVKRVGILVEKWTLVRVISICGAFFHAAEHCDYEIGAYMAFTSHVDTSVAV